MLRRAFCVLVASSVVFADSGPDLGLTPEMLHGIIREVAAKIEARYASERPEAEMLVERIEAILATEPPAPREGDRNQAIAQAMTLIHVQAGASASLNGIHGYLFDSSPTGHLQTYQDLEKLQAKDAEEVRRWLDMRLAARRLKWDEKAALCHERALGAVRGLISREPKNADAHILLAFTLDWQDDSGPETLAALQTALKLSPKHLLASVCLLSRRVSKALESAASRQPAVLSENTGVDLRSLYENPLRSEEVATFETELKQLGKELDELFDSAVGRGDLTSFMHALQVRLELRQNAETAIASHKRPPEASFEDFEAQILQSQTRQVFTLFADAGLLMRCTKLAGNNSEAIGTVTLLAMGGQVMRFESQPTRSSPKGQAHLTAVTQRLLEIARADDSRDAARAAEAVCIIGMLQAMMGQKPEHIDMLHRTLQLDPFRHRSLGFLTAAALMLNDKQSVTATAAMTLQLAALPGLPTRKLAAAGAAKIGDYDTALRWLDECAKEAPGDLMLLHQRIATLLRQSQSKATIKKATLLYGDITPDTILEKTASLEKADRHLFLQTYLLHHLLKPETPTASELLTKLLNEQALDEATAKDVRKWMEK